MAGPQHVVMTVNAAWNILNFRQPLVEALLAEGHRVTILAPRDSAADRLAQLGCNLIDLEMDRKGLNPLQDARLVYRFWHHFDQLKPDIVLSFTIKNNIFGALAARKLGIPFVPNVTGMGTAFLGGPLLASTARFLYRMAFGHLETVFFQNPDDQQYFLEHGLVQAGQARLLPGSGIDLQRFSAAPMPTARSETHFLMIARLLRDKGIHEFVEAARILRAKGVAAQFIVLGATGSENRTAVTQKQLEQWVSEGVVKYLGTTEDVRPAIVGADCIVLPSYREGAPRTLIEAAAMGRPTVATRVPGCTAVVDDGLTGLLCEPRDSNSLATALERFVDLDDRERATMGQAARKKMESEFDVSLVVEGYKTAIRRHCAD